MNSNGNEVKISRGISKNKKEISGTISLLQVGAVLLAAVSFWATAQGMKEYVFEESWQAYAASLAVQGILLGLNFYLPSFLSHAKKLLKTSIILLTCIVMFCSSWFSYVFIAEKVYDKSWDIESRILIQNTYRQVLFTSFDYTKAYRNILVYDLSEQVNSIYELSKKFDQVNAGKEIQIDWNSERNLYASGAVTGDKMNVVISDMENAMVETASQEIRDQLATTLERVASEFQSRIDTIKDNLKTTRAALDLTSDQIENAQNVEEKNHEYIAQLQTQLTAYAEEITNLSNEQTELDSAIDRIGYYRILFTRLQGGNNLQLGVILQNIQKELVSNETDVSSIKNQASDLFNLLQQSSNLFENKDMAYSDLLSMVSTLMYDVDDYAIISSSLEKIQEIIENLANEEYNSNVESKQWKTTWQNKLNVLQNIISALPSYTKDNSLDSINFDKVDASQQLDEMTRLYISEHNAAHQGLIYLASPYWPLAAFSLMLASFFDISGFVVGVIIYTIEKRTTIEDDSNEVSEIIKTNNFDISGNNHEFIITKSFNRYLIFTGDYEKVGEHYIFKAFENAQEVDIIFDTPKTIVSGIYVEKENDYFIPEEQQLNYSSSVEGLKDGIYTRHYFTYDNGMLMISENDNGNYNFLTHISEDVPVYILSEDYIDILNPSVLDKQKAEFAIIALNEIGNAVSAIYIK